MAKPRAVTRLRREARKAKLQARVAWIPGWLLVPTLENALEIIRSRPTPKQERVQT